jgi:hypothetical protein
MASPAAPAAGTRADLISNTLELAFDRLANVADEPLDVQ